MNINQLINEGVTNTGRTPEGMGLIKKINSVFTLLWNTLPVKYWIFATGTAVSTAADTSTVVTVANMEANDIVLANVSVTWTWNRIIVKVLAVAWSFTVTWDAATTAAHTITYTILRAGWVWTDNFVAAWSGLQASWWDAVETISAVWITTDEHAIVKLAVTDSEFLQSVITTTDGITVTFASSVDTDVYSNWAVVKHSADPMFRVIAWVKWLAWPATASTLTVKIPWILTTDIVLAQSTVVWTAANLLVSAQITATGTLVFTFWGNAVVTDKLDYIILRAI